MYPKEDLTGRAYGMWYVNDYAGRNDWGEPLWNCTCMLCGSDYVVNGSAMKKGKSTRCRACSNKTCHTESQRKASQASVKSGLSTTKLYQTLANMHRRCECPENKSYINYGARGIRVCDEWSMENVQAFYNWSIANGYREGLELDRIDTNGNYSPSNCRWVTKKENLRNRTDNFVVCIHGTEMTLAEAVERYSELPYGVVYLRIKRYGWNIEDALQKAKKR